MNATAFALRQEMFDCECKDSLPHCSATNVTLVKYRKKFSPSSSYELAMKTHTDVSAFQVKTYGRTYCTQTHLRLSSGEERMTGRPVKYWIDALQVSSCFFFNQFCGSSLADGLHSYAYWIDYFLTLYLTLVKTLFLLCLRRNLRDSKDDSSSKRKTYEEKESRSSTQSKTKLCVMNKMASGSEGTCPRSTEEKDEHPKNKEVTFIILQKNMRSMHSSEKIEELVSELEGWSTVNTSI